MTDLTIADTAVLTGITFTVVSTTIGAIWSLAWWLSKQFGSIKNLVYQQSSALQSIFFQKLDYHEKHDDERFQSISNDLWMLRLRNAARDGVDIGPRAFDQKEENNKPI